MKKKFSLFVFIVVCSFSFSQSKKEIVKAGSVPGTSNVKSSSLKGSAPHIMDGDNKLGPTYSNTACGLNYVFDSAHVETRYFNATNTLPGCGLPCSWTITGLPPCYIIEKAYVWMLCSYAATLPSSSVTITNPAAITTSYASSGPIGKDIAKCWQESGSATYRWDVTSSISGNGNYSFNFSGFTSTLPPNFNIPSDQIDGATLMIIFRDPGATYQGSLNIWDGAIAGVLNTSQLMTGFNVCATPSSARAFAISSDHQPNMAFIHQTTLNGVTTYFPNIFYNHDEAAVTLTSGQTTSSFGMDGSSGVDCYLWGAMGLYYQTTTCVTCNTAGLTVSVTAIAATCGSNNGSASVSPSGGVPPYAYYWDTGETSSAINNLSPGNYTVTVTGSDGCKATDVINVANNNSGSLADPSYSITPTCDGVNVLFKDLSNSTNWFWDFGDGSTSTLQNPPVHVFTYNGNYNITLIVSSAICKDTTIIPIIIGDINTFSKITVPNVFTPNGDMLNDCFEPITGGPIFDELKKCMTMEIYDQWGIKIFESIGETICWDGKTQNNTKAKDGTYYYLIEIGANTLKGYVTLLREKE